MQTKRFTVSLIILLFCALICATPATTAFAATDTETAITELATADKRVVRAVTVVVERNCLVALQTKGFATKSEYDEYVEQLTADIKAQFEIDRVYVSRSPKVMLLAQKIADADENERQRVIDELIRRGYNNVPTLKEVLFSN